ncbi:MAG: DUF4386 family protein [Legionellales bacterium]|nr:DUF4386 family protein [Legionellales bacterium]
MLIIIPIQIIVFAIFPMSSTIIEWFEIFNKYPIIGLFHSDFFLMIDNILMAVIYLAFYHSLKSINKGLLQIGIIIGLIGIAAYVSTCKTFELLTLSNNYYKTTSEIEKNIIISSGQTMLAIWQGTAFDVYYVLNAITLLIVSLVMYRNSIFGKRTAIIGLITGFFMIIPSTVGFIGLIFSLISLIPWYIFAIRFGKIFKTLSV